MAQTFVDRLKRAQNVPPDFKRIIDSWGDEYVYKIYSFEELNTSDATEIILAYNNLNAESVLGEFFNTNDKKFDNDRYNIFSEQMEKFAIEKNKVEQIYNFDNNSFLKENAKIAFTQGKVIIDGINTSKLREYKYLGVVWNKDNVPLYFTAFEYYKGSVRGLGLWKSLLSRYHRVKVSGLASKLLYNTYKAAKVSGDAMVTDEITLGYFKMLRKMDIAVNGATFADYANKGVTNQISYKVGDLYDYFEKGDNPVIYVNVPDYANTIFETKVSDDGEVIITQTVPYKSVPKNENTLFVFNWQKYEDEYETDDGTIVYPEEIEEGDQGLKFTQRIKRTAVQN